MSALVKRCASIAPALAAEMTMAWVLMLLLGAAHLQLWAGDGYPLGYVQCLVVVAVLRAVREGLSWAGRRGAGGWRAAGRDR